MTDATDPSPVARARWEGKPVDFVILTALDFERDAVLEHLNGRVDYQLDGDPHTYWFGTIQTSDADATYNVIVVMQQSMGNVETAVTATKVVETFQPAHFLFVGIAGGVRDKVRCGDVVVGTTSFYYEPAKEAPDGLRRRSRQPEADRLLLARARAVPVPPWTAHPLGDRPAGEGPPDPKVFFGPIASGEKVVDSTPFLASIVALCPQLLAVAMEGAGLAAAASTAGRGFLEIRGISDYADGEKSDNPWRSYAARAAAAFAAAFLRSHPVPPAPAATPTSTRTSGGKAPRRAALQSFEQRSLTRIASRFLAGGVTPEDATAFAREPHVGLRPGLLEMPDRPVTIVQGDVGAGKSLLLERWYGQALCLARQDAGAPLPVFLDARDLSGDLLDAAAHRAVALGDVETFGVRLFVDGGDEVPLATAARLLQQARELTSAWPSSSAVIATRSAAPWGALPGEIVDLPELTDSESVGLARHVFPQLGGGDALHLPALSLREAVRRPLFALLYGAYLRDHAGAEPGTKADLIASFVDRAIGLAGAPAVELERTLAHLAILSLDQDQAVPQCDVGSPATLRSVLESRLVVLEGSNGVRFSLRLFAEWFGALALRSGLIDVRELSTHPARLERWRYAIAVFLSTASETDASRVFEPIVCADPGFASSVVLDALPSWTREGRAPLDPFVAGGRVRVAMRAWLLGLGPIGTLFTMRRDTGELAPLGVQEHNGWFTTSWYVGSHVREDTFLLPVGAGWSDYTRESPGSNRSARPAEQAAWAWRWAHDDVVDELRRLLKSRELSCDSAMFQKERLWRMALALVGRGSLDRRSIPTSQVATAISRMTAPNTRFFANTVEVDVRAMQSAIDVLAANGQDLFVSPWSGPDLKNRTGSWIWSGFGPERTLELTAGVYGAAMDVLEALVRTWFPSLRHRLPHAAVLPAKLRGRLQISEGVDPRAYAPPFLSMFLEPADEGLPSTVEIEVAPARYSRAEVLDAAARFRLGRGSTSPWLSFFTTTESLAHVFDATPATTIAYRWLEDDLKRIGLLP